MAKRQSARPSQSVTRARYRRFITDPDLSGYENLVGSCTACERTLIVNRATDLRDTYPSSRVQFRCFHCGQLLRPGGDIANHPVDQFVYDAHEPMANRRYMQVVLLCAQSLELALVMCVVHAVLGNVKRPKRVRAASPYARVVDALYRAIDQYTLGTLRKVVANLALRSRPASVDEADEMIAGLKELQKKLPSAHEVAALPEGELREAIERLVGIPNFVKLRNWVVHKARRPTQDQAKWSLNEIPKLTRALLHGFGIARGQLVMPPTAG